MKKVCLLALALLLLPIGLFAQQESGCRDKSEGTDEEPVAKVKPAYPLAIEIPVGDEASSRDLVIRICSPDLQPVGGLPVKLVRYSGELPPGHEGRAPTTDLFESGHFNIEAERDLVTSGSGVVRVGSLKTGKYALLVEWQEASLQEQVLVFDLRWQPSLTPIVSHQGARLFLADPHSSPEST